MTHNTPKTDAELRLHCLQMAVGHMAGTGGDPTMLAERFVTFVTTGVSRRDRPSTLAQADGDA